MEILEKIDEQLNEIKSMAEFKAQSAAGKLMDMDVLKKGRLRDLLIKAKAITSVTDSVKVINQMTKLIAKEIGD